MTSAREAVRVYVQEVRLDTGAPTPMATQLPGAAPASPLFTGDAGAVVAATAASDRGPAAMLAGLGPPWAELGDNAWCALRSHAPLLAGTTTGNGAGAARAVVASAIVDGPLAGHGQIEAWTFSQAPPFAFSGPPATWLLPGGPAAAVTHPAAGWVAVLCRTPNGGAALHVRDVQRGRVIREQVPLARPAERLEPAALALSPDGEALFVLLNDNGTAPNVDEGRCWAAALETRGFAPIGAPIELPGRADADGAFAFSAGGGVWIATRSPSAGFGFVHQLARDGDRYVAGVRQSYTGLTRPIVLGAAGRWVAIGVDRRVEIWENGKPGGDAIPFPAPVTALAWWGETLLAAEANRVHAFAPDRRALWTTPLQTGQVVALLPLAAPVAQGQFDDADGDRLADSIDPEPAALSPRLDVPFEIVLREDAAGAEVRAVRIASDNAAVSSWRAYPDTDAAPWLRVFPRTGRVPGWFVAGVDPSQLGQGGAPSTSIRVALGGTVDRTPAAASPRRVAVRIVPRSAAGRTVLWLLGGHDDGPRDPRDSYGLGALADVLAGPPFYWSHTSAGGRALDSLDDYAVVVLDTGAIGAGLVSRQALLDYVARGGGLLVTAQQRDGEAGVAQRWLAPAGIVFGPGPADPGAMDAVVPHPAARHWQRTELADAVRIAPDAALTALAANSGATGLAVRQFGRGRIAVLASRSPLDSAALNARASRLFALDLFGWLSRAAIETKDLDADGLPDDIEDRNANGVIDPGETAKLDPDSDGDGLPDGKEDANANGAVDEDETSPLNSDSDGDGDWDGADFDPLVRASEVASSGVASSEVASSEVVSSE